MTTAKVAMVTGANSGIGYETIKAFFQSEKPYHILVGSRTTKKAEDAIHQLREECPASTNTLEPLEVDLNSDESIEKAFEQVKVSPGHVDALINNAGATFDLRFLAGKVSLRECFNKAYDANVSGTNVLTWTFMPLLLKSMDPRLIFVSGLSCISQASEKYFPTPSQPAGWPKSIGFETIGYRCSKTALNMLMLDWNHKLKEDGVKVWAVLPGMLATNLGGDPARAAAMGAKHPSLGGTLMKRVVEGEMDSSTGKLISRDGLSQF